MRPCDWLELTRHKYYALELHQAKEKGRTFYRLYTHYGRTDDLEKNPESGQKEVRFFDTLAEAQQTSRLVSPAPHSRRWRGPWSFPC